MRSMATTDNGKKSELLAQYDAAAAEERAAWHLLSNPQLDEAERAKAYEVWKVAAALVKALAIKLQQGAIDSPPPAPASE